MELHDEQKRFGHHDNAFGFLRLLFASLVIISHTPELVDGDRHRELLTRIFGTVSFGELAVDGFFIISGLLISTSFLGSKSIWHYLLKRIGRIWPAFVVTSVICVAVVAPLGGGVSSNIPRRVVSAIIDSGVLRLPFDSYGAFAGSHFQSLNGSLWTIPYEFRCYLLVVLLGLLGLLDKPIVLSGLAVACLVAVPFVPPGLSQRLESQWHLHPGVWIGMIPDTLHLTAMFLAGAAFRSWQRHFILRPWLLIATALTLIAALLSLFISGLAIAICGSYLIFAAAALGRGTILQRINNKNDVSYGLYLYSWPIEKLLIAAGLGSSLFVLGASTWIAALAAGCASWLLIERPVMRMLRKNDRRPNDGGQMTPASDSATTQDRTYA